MMIMPIWQVLFNILFATDMQSFSTPGRSFFTMFRGLLGDIDVDTLVETQPTLGPVVFSLYVTMVLFIAFTILIAIISDSYDAAKDVVPEEGTMVSISRKVQEWTASDEIEQSNSQPRSQQTEMQEMKQSIEHLTRLVEALSQNRAS